jgi:hypothetical protein
MGREAGITYRRRELFREPDEERLREPPFLRDPLRELLLLRDPPLREPRLRGTLPPFSRASLRPMAMACFRLFTFRPEPLLRVPFFRRRIADSTLRDADFPYLAMVTSRQRSAKDVLSRWREREQSGRS